MAAVTAAAAVRRGARIPARKRATGRPRHAFRSRSRVADRDVDWRAAPVQAACLRLGVCGRRGDALVPGVPIGLLPYAPNIHRVRARAEGARSPALPVRGAVSSRWGGGVDRAGRRCRFRAAAQRVAVGPWPCRALAEEVVDVEQVVCLQRHIGGGVIPLVDGDGLGRAPKWLERALFDDFVGDGQ